jgi:DNA-binding IclR family transcriptional regulator
MPPSYTIPALVQSFSVINFISKNPDGVTFTDIVTESGVPKSTVFRILHTLEHYAWVEKRGDRFFLGYMFIHYGLTTLSGRRIADIAAPVLESLVDQTGETAHLAVLSGKHSMILDVRESNKHIKLTSPAGQLLPLYCTSHGKLFLAYIVGNDLEGFYFGETLEKKTEHTITELSALRSEIKKIRMQGYSVDNQEYHENVRCCAAPIFDRSGGCIGAIGVTGTTMTCSAERVEEIAMMIKDSAEGISRQMGMIGN